MGAIKINRLAREDMHRLGIFGDQFVMRQVWVEIQRRDVVEKPQLVKVPESRKWRDLLRAFSQCGTEPVGIVQV